MQLRQLEADGVVRRTVYPEIPARVEYMLTDLGRQLSSVMDELEVWGIRYMEAQKKQRNDGRVTRSHYVLFKGATG